MAGCRGMANSRQNPNLFADLFFWTFWQQCVIQVFASELNMDCLVKAFFDYDRVLFTNSGWLFFGQLVPLVSKTESKVIKDGAFNLAREDGT